MVQWANDDDKDGDENDGRTLQSLFQSPSSQKLHRGGVVGMSRSPMQPDADEGAKHEIPHDEGNLDTQPSHNISNTRPKSNKGEGSRGQPSKKKDVKKEVDGIFAILAQEEETLSSKQKQQQKSSSSSHQSLEATQRQGSTGNTTNKNTIGINVRGLRRMAGSRHRQKRREVEQRRRAKHVAAAAASSSS